MQVGQRLVRVQWRLRSVAGYLLVASIIFAYFGDEIRTRYQNIRTTALLQRTCDAYWCQDEFELVAEDGGTRASTRRRGAGQANLGIQAVDRPIYATFGGPSVTPGELRQLSLLGGMQFTGGSNLNSQHISALGQCARIERLDFSGQELTRGRDWKPLFSLPRLKALCLSDCNVDPDVLRDADLPNLEVLSLRGPKLNDAALTAIATGMPRLKHLFLDRVPAGKGLKDILRIRGLKTLHLSNCELNESSLRSANLPHLQTLTLHGGAVTDSMLRLIPARMPRLEHLSLQLASESVSQKGLDILRSLEGLKSVSVGRSGSVGMDQGYVLEFRNSRGE